jgi:hypothetical protein
MAMRPSSAGGAIATLAAAIAVAGCGGGDGEDASAAEAGGLPQGSEHVELDPAEFTTEIDNRYWPMAPGSRWVYRETEGDESQRVVVTVTDRTKTIAGIEARVVRDVVSDEATGDPVEVTDDYYAQDADGNIWYLGEDTTEYENGKPVSTAGSFHAGVDGAEAGVAMPADPQQGLTYRQEYYAGEAEDVGEVLRTGEQAEAAFGRFDDVLVTRDINPLEPKIVEYKFYAPDVGPLLTLDVSGASGREELLRYTPGG